MELLTFEPILKTTRWGGRRLGTLLNKPIGEGDRYAESWELADFKEDQSRVSRGFYKDLTLQKLISNHKEELLGKHSHFSQFPLLVKFLDVADTLSLQVHPDDEYTRSHKLNTTGKTEAWIVLDCTPESRIYAGLKEKLSPEEFQARIHSGEIDSSVHSFTVSKGDTILVPAGTVHALGEGLLLAEYQQMSQFTYRLHDWGRLDLNGQPRELHWEEAIASIHYDQGPILPVSPIMIDEEIGLQELIHCRNFIIREYRTSRVLQLQGNLNYFRVYTIISGSAEIRQGKKKEVFQTGQTFLAPAVTEDFSITPLEDLQILEAYLP